MSIIWTILCILYCIYFLNIFSKYKHVSPKLTKMLRTSRLHCSTLQVWEMSIINGSWRPNKIKLFLINDVLQVKSNERNGRNDLYVLANSYSGRLKAIKPTLMPETDFHIVPKRPPPTSRSVNGTTENSSSTGEPKTPTNSSDVKAKVSGVLPGDWLGNWTPSVIVYAFREFYILVIRIPICRLMKPVLIFSLQMEPNETANGEVEIKEEKEERESKKAESPRWVVESKKHTR